jgi:plasmid segregation protein ParM
MLAEIAQKGFDLEENKTVFMGGGSILLEDYILQSGKVKKPIFIDDVHANANGYRKLYDAQNGGTNRQLHSA